MKRLSIIIVTYKSEKDIYQCIQSIWDNCDIPRNEIEVIVVDNSPACEPMFSNLRRQHNDIILIHNTHNGGYGQGNNVGIRKATAPIIMIMNPDVRLCQPVFKKSLGRFDANKDLVLYGLTQRLSNNKIGPATHYWISSVHPYIATPLRFVMRHFNIFWAKYMYVSGACFFLRKKSFEDIGLFDERLFMYGEEEDIHERLMTLPNAKMEYARNLNYLHLHNVPTDFTKETHEWQERHLEALFIINRRKGIPDSKTIDWAIKRNNFSIWKETVKYVLTRKANKERLYYFKEWKQTLIKKLSNVSGEP